MSLGRWAKARPSRGEVRTRSKIGRIAGRIPSVFRHGSDENGVGWSDIASPKDGLFPAVVGIPAAGNVDSVEVRRSQSVPADTATEASGCPSSEYPSVESAFLAACTARALLVCDAESTEAGQAARLRGYSLGGDGEHLDMGFASSRGRAARRRG